MGSEMCIRDRRSVDRGERRRGIELRNQESGVPTLLSETEGNTGAGDLASLSRTPRSRRPSACGEVP